MILLTIDSDQGTADSTLYTADMTMIGNYNPCGIDIPILNLRESLERELMSLWNLTTDKVRSFGRAYKIDGKQREYTTKYSETDNLLDDKYALQFFFMDVEKREFTDAFQTFGTHFRVPVDILFFVNLALVKPLISWRADEEVKQDVFNVVLQGSGNFGSFDVIDLDGYNAKMNMQPFHSFKVTTNLSYRYDKTF